MKTAEIVIKEVTLKNHKDLDLCNLGFDKIWFNSVTSDKNTLEAMHTYAAQFQQKWVDVKDRYPEQQDILAGFWRDHQFVRDVILKDDISNSYFTHWQPLPTQPNNL